MKKMSLNDTWKNCLAMWKWIAGNYETTGCYHISKKKEEWLKSHRFTKKRIYHCFFCAYTSTSFAPDCRKCPAFANKANECRCEIYKSYSWAHNPKAFYAKLVELNEIRLKGKSNEN